MGHVVWTGMWLWCLSSARLVCQAALNYCTGFFLCNTLHWITEECVIVMSQVANTMKGE